MSHNRFRIRSLILSIVLIILGFHAIIELYADLAESVAVIEASRTVRNEPEALSAEIASLNRRKENLKARWKRYHQRQYTHLEAFSDIAGRHHLKLTGIRFESATALAPEQPTRYRLTLSGGLADALEALDHIENNLYVIFESIVLKANDNDHRMIDMNLTMRFPENPDETEQD